MAIKKKFIGNDQIDGSKISLLNNQALSAQNTSGSELEILKIDSSNKLQLLQLPQVSSDPSASNDLVRKSYVDSAVGAATITIAQTKHVSALGNDSTGDGSLAKPFATISAALASITDATPTKRYAVNVAPGNYTEGAGLALKANVFVIGVDTRLVRITGAVSLASDFTGSADNRSGFSKVTLLSAVSLDWAAVTSAAGKIYCRDVLFSSTVSLNGHNNAIAQAMFDQCQFFGAFTVSGINIGAHTDNIHFSTVTLNQHPNGGMATILNALGCSFGGAVTANAAVSDFNRRCSLFFKSCFVDALTVNGPSAYADMSNDSVPRYFPNSTNGGNLVYVSPVSPGGVQPDGNNSRNIGDFGKQWFFNFAYVHASTGTDLYLTSTAASFGPDSAGRSIYIQPDGYGLNTNVNGGDIVLETAAVTGTGVRGKVDVKARVVELNDVQVKELADGTDPQDAVTKAQLDLKLDASEVGLSVASLVDGKVPTSELPSIVITDTFVVADEAAMLALTAETGDVAIRTDVSKSFILAEEPASTLANWKELLAPPAPVTSVNGEVGDVWLNSDDVGEGPGNLYFTEERAASAAAAQQKHKRIVLSATDISNGYIDVDFDIIGVPLVFNGPSRMPLLPTDDFSVSGARITWNPATVGPGGEEAMVEDEIIHVFYMG